MASVLTPVGKLSFPSLFTARPPMDGKGDPRYEATLIITPDFQKTQAFKNLQQAVVECAKGKFGTKWKSIKMPFKKGSEVTWNGPDDDDLIIKAWSKQKPGLQHKKGGVPVPLEDETDIYPGAWVRLDVTPFAYDNSGNKGVSFALNNVNKIQDGSRIDGRKSAAEAFADGETEEDELLLEKLRAEEGMEELETEHAEVTEDEVDELLLNS